MCRITNFPFLKCIKKSGVLQELQVGEYSLKNYKTRPSQGKELYAHFPNKKTPEPVLILAILTALKMKHLRKVNDFTL